MPSDVGPRTDASKARRDVHAARLLHVLGYAGVSGKHAGQTGVERVVEQLLSGLDGFQHRIVYPQAGALLERYEEQAEDVLVREASGRFDRRFVDDVARYIHDHRIDLVLSHGFLRNDFLTALACRRSHRPHVVCRAVPLADEGIPWPRHLLYSLLDAWTLRGCAHVIACSQATRQRMMQTQRLTPQNITSIPNGVLLPRVQASSRERVRAKLGIDSTAILVGGVGQLIARKRFVDLVEALARVRQGTSANGRNVVCVLLGRGPEQESLRQRARELDVPLTLPGFVDEPWETIAAFDIAVLPSRAEGMPLSVLESMALGVPTIATDVAGTPEIIEDGCSGLLFTPGDVATLSQRLTQLCDDVQLRASLGASGAERVAAGFSLQAMLDGFDRCLRSVIAAHR